MKHLSFLGIVFCLACLCSVWLVSANSPYQCGSDRITGQLTSSDPLHTTVVISIKQGDQLIQSSNAIVTADWSYVAPFSWEQLSDGVYTIESVATLSWLVDSRTYETYLGKDCGVCGNWFIDDNEQCESDSDCTDWLKCLDCSCLGRDEVKKLIYAYADEVAAYKANQAEQVVPSSFIATGWPFSFVDSLIKKLGVKFASSKSSVYHTVPDWTLDPTIDIKKISLESVYASLPTVYQNKQSYLRFKWLFVPLETVGKYATPSQVLEKLNEGAVLAPETPSVNTLWAVKMIYTHALSFTDSPFAGIGSYISVFGTWGDQFFVYVKKSQRTYEQRTYTIKSKFQIDPEKTEILKKFAKEWADSIALITCRDGDVLWSTRSREIILADRVRDEMGDFQKAMIALGDDKKLADARKKIDAYLTKKELSDEQVVKLVAKLDEVSDNGKWNPLAVIATYGKYMAAYDAVYNDKSL